MGRFDACLVDAYNTIVYTDYAPYRDELPALAGLPADVLYGEFRRLGPAVGTGRITLAEAFAAILRAGGAEPRPELVRALTDRTRELLPSARGPRNWASARCASSGPARTGTGPARAWSRRWPRWGRCSAPGRPVTGAANG